LIEYALDRSWSDNLNQTNTWMNQERQTTSHEDDEQTNVALRWRIQKIKNKTDGKITYFNKREIVKRVRGAISGKKIDPKSTLFSGWRWRN